MSDKKNIEEEFDDLLNTDFSSSINSSDDDIFSDLDEEEQNHPTKKEQSQFVSKNEEYKRTKTDLHENISELQGSINSMLEQLDTPIEDMLASRDLLPGLDLEIVQHDYEKDIELIKIESKETLECLANLYLDEDMMKNKNIYRIIKDDAKQLSELNFSIECARKTMISCQKQIDMGVNDPLMYQSVAMFVKEIRESVKVTLETQRKMKDFYKTLKVELKDLNTGPEQVTQQPMVTSNNDNLTIIGDPKILNEMFEKQMQAYKNDPTLISKKK